LNPEPWPIRIWFPRLPPGYAQKSLATADARLALAGYRLAAVLEEVAKGL
jgi:hypothetical protein